MSIVLFDLKKEHLLLLKHLSWSLDDNKFIISTEDIHDEPTMYNTVDIYEGIDIILNGKPENFDPFNAEELASYSDEQKAEWDKLLKELPTALDIILKTQGFTLARYVSRFHEKDWKITTTHN
jgi:hypothetical protein